MGIGQAALHGPAYPIQERLARLLVLGQPHLHLIRLLPHNAAHPGGSSPGESDFAVLRLFMDMPCCLCVEA